MSNVNNIQINQDVIIEISNTMNICNITEVNSLLYTYSNYTQLNSTSIITTTVKDVGGRFFFLKYPQTFSCVDNFLNIVVIFILVIMMLLLIIFVVYFILERKERRNQLDIEYIRKEVIGESNQFYTKKDIDRKYEYNRKIELPKIILKKKDIVLSSKQGSSSKNNLNDDNIEVLDINKQQLENSKFKIENNLKRKQEILELQEKQINSIGKRINQSNIFDYNEYQQFEEVSHSEKNYNKIQKKTKGLIKKYEDKINESKTF